jgi:hypothetical protein
MDTAVDIGPTLTHLPPCFSHTQAQIRSDQSGKRATGHHSVCLSDLIRYRSDVNNKESHTTNILYHPHHSTHTRPHRTATIIIETTTPPRHVSSSLHHHHHHHPTFLAQLDDSPVTRTSEPPVGSSIPSILHIPCTPSGNQISRAQPHRSIQPFHFSLT